MTSSSTPSSSSRRRYTDEVNWPEDVIAEIIVRLPIKSILRFKSTCKTWYSLTESPHFIKLYRTHHRFDVDNRQNQMLFSSDQTFQISMISPPPSTNQTTLFHLGTTLDKAIGPVKRRSSMGGIHALGPLNNSIYCVVESDQCGGYTSKAAIYNLATRKFELFKGRSPFTIEAPFWLVRNLTHHYGFGCLIHNDVIIDYKMVAIQQDIKCHKQWFRFYVYSSCSGSWSQIRHVQVYDENGNRQFPTITQDSCLIPSQPLMFNGRCHWMAKWPGQVRRDDKHCVVPFDMTKEVFDMIPGPPDEYYHLPLHERHNLVKTAAFVLHDRLAALILSGGAIHPMITDYVDVWMMMGHGSWTKIYSCHINYEYNYLTRFLGIFMDDDTIKKLFFLDAQGTLVSCHLNGFERHCTTLDPNLTCWKPFGLSSCLETVEPVTLQHR